MSGDVIVEPPQAPPIPGVRPEVAHKVGEMLARGRRYFGSSGASLTYQAFDPKAKRNGLIKPESAKIGLEGERSTTKALKEWIQDKPNAVLVDSVHIRGWGKEDIDEETGVVDNGDTDHVIIIGDDVILVDTKRWKSKKNYAVADDGSVLRYGKPFPGGKVHMSRAIHLWLDYLVEEARVTGFVCINAEDAKVFRNRNWYTHEYRLVEITRLHELLDSKWQGIADEDKTHINTTLVSQIVVSAVKPFDPYARVFDMQKIRDFH